MHNKLAFLLIWNVCFKDRDQVCDHLLLVAAFKVTLMHQDSNKIAKNWSFSLQVSLAIMWNLFMITWRLTVTNGQKSQTCCRLLQTYCHLHSHVILTIQPEKARKFRNSSTNGTLPAIGVIQASFYIRIQSEYNQLSSELQKEALQLHSSANTNSDWLQGVGSLSVYQFSILFKSYCSQSK